MATTDPQVLDPTYTMTPTDFAASQRAILTGQYPGFDKTLGDFKPAAEGELAPYYRSVFDQLGSMQTQAEQKSIQNYDQLTKKLAEQYNARGTFFGGEAIGAANTLAGNEATDLSNIGQTYDTKRQATAVEQNDATIKRAQQMQQQAFDEYQTKMKGDVEKQVADKLAEYIPGYAKAVQKQLADANSPWLEVPLQEGVDWSNIDSTASTNTNNNPKGYGRYLTPAEAKSGKYKGKVVVIKGSGIRFKTPADEPK